VGQCSLADLARAEQSHSRHMVKAVPDQSFDSARYLPCNYGILRQICKEGLRSVYSFTCTTCAGSKPLKCVAEALL
jgi:hypothetical protein